MLGRLSFVVGSYLLGSIPFAYLAGRWIKNIDIRQHGTGNIGGSNVFRSVGKFPGILVTLADIGKGVILILVGKRLQFTETVLILGGLAVIVGHNWSVFLRFQGGRGVATSIGTLLALVPRELLIAAIPMIVLAALRNTAMGVGLGIFLLPFLALIGHRSRALIIYCTAVVILIIIKRLWGIYQVLPKVKDKKKEILNRLLRDAGSR